MTYETQSLIPKPAFRHPIWLRHQPLSCSVPLSLAHAAAHTVPCDVITILPLCKNRLSKAEKKNSLRQCEGSTLGINHSMVRQRPGHLSQIGDKLRSITLILLFTNVRSAHLPSSGH